MNVNEPKTHEEGSKVDALESKRTLDSYDDLLPASHRTSDDDVQSPTATPAFLKKELNVDRLNAIHHVLWIVGRPMPPRPLYYQRAVGRSIVVHEKMDLHLVWNEERIFLKPVPRYLLDQNFWRDLLSCKDRCSSRALQYNCDDLRDGKVSWTSTQEVAEIESRYCERCVLRRLAAGFLITYTSLIAYEHDFDIAKASKLIPQDLSWLDWRAIVKDWLTPEKRDDINPRYHYGELRLSRLNYIYMLNFRSPVRGYLSGYRTYHQFWNDNLSRLAAALAYVIVVLTAMQVGLATDRLSRSDSFERVSYGFTVFSILSPLVFLGAVGLVYLAVFFFNLLETLRYSKKRFAVIETRSDAACTP